MNVLSRTFARLTSLALTVLLTGCFGSDPEGSSTLVFVWLDETGTSYEYSLNKDGGVECYGNDDNGSSYTVLAAASDEDPVQATMHHSEEELVFQPLDDALDPEGDGVYSVYSPGCIIEGEALEGSFECGDGGDGPGWTVTGSWSCEDWNADTTPNGDDPMQLK